MKVLIFFFLLLICGISKSQTMSLEGNVLFYYNPHPSDLKTDDLFYSLDSVRFITSEIVYAVWADYSQEEHFIHDTSLQDMVYGKVFKIWDSVPQYSSVMERNNYYHIGGDTYYDSNNEIVIAFHVNGVAFMVNPNSLNYTNPLIVRIKNKHEQQSDSVEIEQTVWHDYRTINKGEYLVFQKINKSETLSVCQRKKLGLKKRKERRFLLYGN